VLGDKLNLDRNAFRILKRIFGFDKVRYRGLAKNHHRLCANFALVNLYLHRKRLAPLRAWGVRRQENGCVTLQLRPRTARLRK